MWRCQDVEWGIERMLYQFVLWWLQITHTQVGTISVIDLDANEKVFFIILNLQYEPEIVKQNKKWDKLIFKNSSNPYFSLF